MQASVNIIFKVTPLSPVEEKKKKVATKYSQNTLSYNPIVSYSFLL